MKIVKLLFILMCFNSLAYADKNMKIGSKGNENDISRVIKVIMYDNYYEPSSFQINAGETIKFEIDGNSICIDGTGSENKILLEDMEADCTITMAGSLMEDLKNGKINPMMAVMSGKLKIKGDQGLAMKLQAFM